MKSEWIDQALLAALEAEGTNAHRLCTIDDGWVERFADDVLVSFKSEPARERLLADLDSWQVAVAFDIGRIFTRFLPKKNEERSRPELVSGKSGEPLRTTVTENFLKYGIDFEAGYSVGLFVDQRENRRFVRQSKPTRLLNCFAYTCSFSVAAASADAQTVNIDLSKKSLDRGRENFELNRFDATGHRFIADDVMTVLPRMARKGERFDTIILDPPTFSRSHRGKIFHAAKDFEALLLAALEVATPDCRILLSTNCSSLDERKLEAVGRFCLKLTRAAANFHRQSKPVDFPPGTGAGTIWMSLR